MLNKNILWKWRYGDKTEIKDEFGNEMNQSNCTIDHIFPKSMNGSSTIENLTLLSKESNLKKGNRITGNINGLQFEVRKIGKSKHGKKIGKLHIKK